MVEKDRWERMKEWAEGGTPEPEGYVPTWAARVMSPEPPKLATEGKPKSKPKVDRSEQEEFDRMMEQTPGDDPSDRGVS